MCAIAGVFFTNNTKNLSCVMAMIDCMTYRGPDDRGELVIEEMEGALAHRRLSILDLSSQGHQPMVSACHTYSLAYNGEIYNYQAIKAELLTQSIKFKGHSDTEVLLQALLVWGIDKTLQKIDGMFAFAFVDHRQKKIYLARDRFGEKPLYYAWCKGTFLFASDLNGLKAYKGWGNLTINPQAVAAFLRYSYVPDPYTIYENVHKVRPGSYLEITASHIKETAYFKAQEVALNAALSPYRGSFEDAVEDIHTDLSHSVGTRTLADVPLGCFLSGGIDSSLIAALLQKQSATPIKTFTIGFHDPSYNEAPFAKKIAEFLGTDHEEFYVTDKEARDVIPSLPSLYGEPFADSSQIPTFLVSQMARQKIKVCLSGDGGDEMFGGYNRHVFASHYLPFLQTIPTFLIPLLKRFCQSIKVSRSDFLQGVLKKIPGVPDVSGFASKLDKIEGILDHIQDPASLYQILASTSPESPSLLTFLEQALLKDIYKAALPPPLAMMLADSVSYLPGDILTKVDRASMGVSLEVRSPYLDPLLFEKSFSFPLTYTIKNNKGKAILRAIGTKYIPDSLLERPKTGFSIPVGRWMRSSLREWCETLLAPHALKESGFFQEDKVREIWHAHLSKKRDYSSLLWNVIAFQQWFLQK